ncbi:MAG: hypothetical protein OEZ01_16090, partial [Candidatus Heimdallarchaeota archaeon]|nr:hypothetical protein [Candidatus Heimdallarchaeota archaeon]
IVLILAGIALTGVDIAKYRNIPKSIQFITLMTAGLFLLAVGAVTLGINSHTIHKASAKKIDTFNIIQSK